MRSLIHANSSMLMLLSRFRIPLGFGDDSVEDVCGRAGTHADTFLAVANFIDGRDYTGFHSGPAITVYAILYKLVDIKDVK